MCSHDHIIALGAEKKGGGGRETERENREREQRERESLVLLMTILISLSQASTFMTSIELIYIIELTLFTNKVILSVRNSPHDLMIKKYSVHNSCSMKSYGFHSL